MKTKLAKRYVYHGLGFPIILLNVRLVQARGVWAPAIRYNALQKQVLLALTHKSTPLTGDEIYFIRTYFEMTLDEFAMAFGLTHPAIVNWEKARAKPAKISPTTELCIRLWILEQLGIGNQAFRHAFREFNIQQIAKEQKAPVRLQKPMLFPGRKFAKKLLSMRV